MLSIFRQWLLNNEINIGYPLYVFPDFWSKIAGSNLKCYTLFKMRIRVFNIHVTWLVFLFHTVVPYTSTSCSTEIIHQYTDWGYTHELVFVVILEFYNLTDTKRTVLFVLTVFIDVYSSGRTGEYAISWNYGPSRNKVPSILFGRSESERFLQISFLFLNDCSESKIYSNGISYTVHYLRK